MKRFLINVCIGIWLATLFSCSNKLELKPLSSFSDKDVWSDPKLAELYVNNIYSRAVFTFKDAGFGWGAQTDELYSNFNWMNENTAVTGQGTPDNFASTLNYWSTLYGTVRHANIFFANAGRLPAQSANGVLVERLKGEVRFLRALTYFELLKRFGGVPLIEKVYNVDDNTFQEKRATWNETKDFILADLNEALRLLPEKFSNDQKGRATKGAVLALRSRLLLYAASPRYNPSGNADRWREARDAAKKLIDLNGYALYGSAANGTYNNTFLDFFNAEVIMARVYNETVYEDRFNTYDRDMSPNGYEGYSAYNPVQQLVDDFAMADGTAFDWSNTIHAANPYQNREPRFYAAILANNQSFKGRLTQFYEGGDDSPQSPFSPWNASKTRYCVRKMVDDNHDWLANVPNSKQWVIFRLSEIFLNYAEACAALGETGEAQLYLNKVRKEKGGLPEIFPTGVQLMERIRHERRIELCFEGHRFFDIRRWGIAETGSKNAEGVVIKKGTDGTFTYTRFVVQQRKWVPAFYYYPIPRSETQKNNNIEQNPEY